jgi:hypothetical protein
MNRLVGFSIVEADSIDAAVEMAKKCPHLAHGTIDVAEAMDMKMGSHPRHASCFAANVQRAARFVTRAPRQARGDSDGG